MRHATVDDAAAIGEINVLSWQAAYAGLVPDDFLQGLSADARAQFWASVLGDPDGSGTVLVAEAADEDARPAGFAAFGPCLDDAGSDAGQLYAIYLHPKHWARGLGRLLHGQVVRGLVDGGYRTAVLWVLATNERAKAFYVREGWVADGATQSEVLEGGAVTLEEIRFRRSLP